jgi:hypothetical protein
MKLKKIELNQETLKNLTNKPRKKNDNVKVASNNPACSFIISCPKPCVG